MDSKKKTAIVAADREKKPDKKAIPTVGDVKKSLKKVPPPKPATTVVSKKKKLPNI